MSERLGAHLPHHPPLCYCSATIRSFTTCALINAHRSQLQIDTKNRINLQLGMPGFDG